MTTAYLTRETDHTDRTVWHMDIPGNKEYLDLFGTTKLPTSFLGCASAAVVLAALRPLNPDITTWNIEGEDQ